MQINSITHFVLQVTQMSAILCYFANYNEIHIHLELTVVNNFTHAILLDTYTAKIFVQQLNVTMNNFKCQKFIVSLLNSTTKIKTSISGTQDNTKH
jgi:hypothetical protein